MYRKSNIKKVFLLSLLLLMGTEAGELNYQAEIEHLLKYVQTTSCKYIRNGDEHDGRNAAKHIENKYDYFQDEIHTAEDFIRLSATKSTMSGKKYYIQCKGMDKIESAQWLLKELNRYRKKKTK